MAWQPTIFLRYEETFATSMRTARIVTDAGPAYIKVLGNPQGPHHLACELVATQLANWFGLPILPFALMQIDADVDEIPLDKDSKATSGTAFLTQATAGHPWGGSADELEKVINPEAISRLVLFDTWIRNYDRHPPDPTIRKPNYDNVFLADASDFGNGALRLIAMDHTHCFCGPEDLNGKIASIDRIKDDRVYGLFPPFRSRVRQEELMAGVSRLKELKLEVVRDIVQGIPNDWDVTSDAKVALIELICQRAEYVAVSIPDRISQSCWPGQLFDVGE